MVALVHPDLPDRQLNVAESAVHHYERSGWLRAGEPVDVPEAPAVPETLEEFASPHARDETPETFDETPA